MEGDVGLWSLEFLLGKSNTDSNLLKKLIRTIPVSNSDSRLKKLILLKTLQDELSTASIGESMLQTLEVLEEVLRCEGSPVTAAMGAAYCGVAVECTLKYLEVEVPHPAFLEAVERIWRGRVQYMEHGSLLFSEELNAWRSDIEASLSESTVMERLAASVNTRRDAINKLKVYLAEAWANIGPSFLELIAASTQKQKQQHTGFFFPTLVSSIEIGKDNQLVEGKWATTGGTEEMVPSTSGTKIDTVPSHLECGSLELQTLANDALPTSLQMCDIGRSELESKDMNQGAPMEKQNRDADVPDPHGCQSIGNDEANLKEPTTVQQSDVHRPSLMEPNTTARIHEWDDSIDDSKDGTFNHASRFHLPSPKRKKHSPLKKYEPAKITNRRKPRKWSELEEGTLRTAVDKFGIGNWKLILNSHRDAFENRTEVDLKDKWRNMSRYGSK